MKRVDKVPELTNIPLSYEERTGHLPHLLRDVIIRLRLGKSERAPTTTSAHDHGKVRSDQGYSVPMLIEESRLLQISIFDTLHLNQGVLDPQVILLDVMTIADECDLQLQHTMETFLKFASIRAVA
jgi:hypothetical protein